MDSSNVDLLVKTYTQFNRFKWIAYRKGAMPLLQLFQFFDIRVIDLLSDTNT